MTMTENLMWWYNQMQSFQCKYKYTFLYMLKNESLLLVTEKNRTFGGLDGGHGTVGSGMIADIDYSGFNNPIKNNLFYI